MYCDPWSCRTESPRAMLLGEAAEMLAHALAKRFERLEAGGARCGVNADARWTEQWSTCDEHRRRTSPVMVVVKSVPHIVSTVSGMMVPSWLRGPRGDPTAKGRADRCRASAATPVAWRSAPRQHGAAPESCGGLRREMGFWRGRRGSRQATPHPAWAQPVRARSGSARGGARRR